MSLISRFVLLCTLGIPLAGLPASPAAEAVVPEHDVVDVAMDARARTRPPLLDVKELLQDFRC